MMGSTVQKLNMLAVQNTPRTSERSKKPPGMPSANKTGIQRRSSPAEASTALDEWLVLAGQIRKLDPVARHNLVSQGVSTKVLYTLLDSFEKTSRPDVFSVLGFSSKTASRRKNMAMSLPASDATVSLIEIKSLAETVFGSSALAEEWLNKPALALDHHKPMELIATRPCAELVREHLIRLDYGVAV